MSQSNLESAFVLTEQRPATTHLQVRRPSHRIKELKK